MRVLILESVSGLCKAPDARLLPEGFAMLRTMVNEFEGAGFEVLVVLSKRLKPLSRWLNAEVIFSRDWISEALSRRPDGALIIAPERGRELERLTAKLKAKVRVLGSPEGAIRVAANKWLTYLTLKGKVPQPGTWQKPPSFGRVLAKPIDGVGCEGIELLTHARERRRSIYQEFIEGEHVSCCLLMREGGGAVLSVNKQEISMEGGKFEYWGSDIPLEHELEGRCAEVALHAAGVAGLKGYCGADLVVNEAPYLIELNPRLTTSFIALAQVLGANLGELLVDAILNGSPLPKSKLRGRSLVRILRAKRWVKLNQKRLDGLLEIPEVIAPPLAFDGRLSKGSPILVAAGSGASAKAARRKLREGVAKAFSILGVDPNAIAWA